MAQHKEDFFVETASDQIHVTTLSDDSLAPKALLVCSFGISRDTENKKDYDPVRGIAKYMSDGILTVVYSPAGMGRSGGDTHKLTLKKRVEEFDRVVKTVLEKYPSVPLYVYGASMGAQVVLSALADIRPAGLILCSPAIYADRAMDSLFDGKDFRERARLTGEDEPYSFTAMRALKSYYGPIMLTWMEKDTVSLGGPINDSVYEAVAKCMSERASDGMCDVAETLIGTEHGIRINGVDAVERIEDTARKVRNFITENLNNYEE